MQDLHPHANKLLAYADNTLSISDRLEVEKLLASDASASAFLEQLKISDLPFADSFKFLLDDLDQNHEVISKPSTPETPVAKQTKWLWPVSLAASLLLGIIVTFFSINATTEDHDNWIVQVADYHLLYIRETVIHSNLNDSQIEQLSNALGNQLKTHLTIPDLSKQNLQFKRGQTLDSNGQKLVQLAYLPKDGRPVALCILRTNETDSLPTAGKSRGLPYVTWTKSGLSYVIIGAIDKKDLNNAALNALSQMGNNNS